MEIRTERLVVRRFRPDDWRDLFDYLSLPAVYAFEPGEPIDAEQAVAMAEERSRGSTFLAVELREERRMIGHLSFAPVQPAELRTYELGYIVNPRDHGRGYATEAAAALVRHSFTEMGVHRVTANCDPANVASWRVLEKIGFVREGHLRRNVFFRRDANGLPTWKDTFVYGLLNEVEAPGPGSPVPPGPSGRR